MKSFSSVFSDRFCKQCILRGMPPRYTLKNVFGMDGSNLSKWRDNESTPRVDIVVAAADYFGVTTDELLGRSAPTLGSLTEEEQGVVERLRQCDSKTRALALRLLDVLVSDQAEPTAAAEPGQLSARRARP